MIRYVNRNEYSPPAYRVLHTDLTFLLDSECTSIDSVLTLERTNEGEPGRSLQLDGRDFELVSLALDGQTLRPQDYTFENEVLSIPNAPAHCQLAVRTRVTPGANHSQMGLFQAGRCLVTQCEADGFRRMTFYIDRPDVMSSFRVRLEGDAVLYPVLLSNGDCIDAGQLADGRHYAVFDDPHPKPSYVFAVMAGDLAVLRDTHVTGTGKSVELAIYAEPQHIADSTFAMGALKRALAWDETEYGLEYDLTRYSIVAIDDYSGAMENKGLNLFEAKGILANPAYSTDNDYQVLERILGHEVFHNWTGNRVTCRDWFELCLKEGLTRFRDRQFAEAMSAPGPKRIDAVALLRRNQFVEDDGNTAHPVKPARYADVQNLYTATVYEKGAELIRMLHVLLGPDVFRQGVQNFLARYDGQAVTTDELIGCMEQVSGRDLSGFRPWYEYKGRPRILVRETYDAGQKQYQLHLTQALANSESPPLLTPVSYALLTKGAGATAAITAEGVLELEAESQVFTFDDIPMRPVVSLLRGLSAPVSLVIERADQDLALLMIHETDPVARWDAVQQFATLIVRRLAQGLSPAGAGATQFSDAFGQLINDQVTEPALLARLLTLPDEPTLSDGLDQVDVDGHAQGRDMLCRLLAKQHEQDLLARYQALASTRPYAPEPIGMARRALRNACLNLLAATGEKAQALCLEQIRASDNMNDAYAGLAALCHINCPERDEAIAFCLEKWRPWPLAMGAWLTAQGLGKTPDTVDRVMALTEHPDVNLRDAGQSMALFGAFFRQNRLAFHDRSGKGYEFLADVLLRMDQAGQSGSFWLMPQIAQWRRYDAVRQQLMKKALERVRDTSGISRGLAENVSRALDTSAS
ncbi:MAG: aminopeptidase N [Pseudomonadota bacterium]